MRPRPPSWKSCLIEGGLVVSGPDLIRRTCCQIGLPGPSQRQSGRGCSLGTPCGGRICLTNGTCRSGGISGGGAVVCVADEVASGERHRRRVLSPPGPSARATPARSATRPAATSGGSSRTTTSPCGTAFRTGRTCFRSLVCVGGHGNVWLLLHRRGLRVAAQTDPATGPVPRSATRRATRNNWSTLWPTTRPAPTSVPGQPHLPGRESALAMGAVVCAQTARLGVLPARRVRLPGDGGLRPRDRVPERAQRQQGLRGQCQGNAFFGECTGGKTQPVDCGVCGVCDQKTGTCTPEGSQAPTAAPIALPAAPATMPGSCVEGFGRLPCQRLPARPKSATRRRSSVWRRAHSTASHAPTTRAANARDSAQLRAGCGHCPTLRPRQRAMRPPCRVLLQRRSAARPPAATVAVVGVLSRGILALGSACRKSVCEEGCYNEPVRCCGSQAGEIIVCRPTRLWPLALVGAAPGQRDLRSLIVCLYVVGVAGRASRSTSSVGPRPASFLFQSSWLPAPPDHLYSLLFGTDSTPGPRTAARILLKQEYCRSGK